MILELHFPINDDETLLSAWETSDMDSFTKLKEKAENLCSKYSSHFQVRHNDTGNSLFVVSSEKEDYDTIHQILNKYCDNNNIETLVF